MKCPLCKHQLKEVKDNIGGDFAEEEWQYDCSNCGRAWRILQDGSWVALFDASQLTYSKKEVEEIQKEDED
jgi:transposase-like protein